MGNAKIRGLYSDPNSFFNELRKKRAAHFTGIIERIHAAKGSVRILDPGGSPSYWSILGKDYLDAHDVTITLVNLYPQESPGERFEARVGDACALEMEDDSFDLVHSNSVIEHVGSDEKMEAFAGEVRRLAPAYFVQTPNFWFPYEPHMRAPLVHWLPQAAQARIVKAFQLNAEGRIDDLDEARKYLHHNRPLKPGKMRRLFPDADIRIEHLFGLPKSIMAVRETR